MTSGLLQNCFNNTHDFFSDQFDQQCQYLWRLARAYADAHDFALDLTEKKSSAENGNTSFYNNRLICVYK